MTSELLSDAPFSDVVLLSDVLHERTDVCAGSERTDLHCAGSERSNMVHERTDVCAGSDWSNMAHERSNMAHERSNMAHEMSNMAHEMSNMVRMEHPKITHVRNDNAQADAKMASKIKQRISYAHYKVQHGYTMLPLSALVALLPPLAGPCTVDERFGTAWVRTTVEPTPDTEKPEECAEDVWTQFIKSQAPTRCASPAQH